MLWHVLTRRDGSDRDLICDDSSASDRTLRKVFLFPARGKESFLRFFPFRGKQVKTIDLEAASIPPSLLHASTCVHTRDV